MLLSGGTRNRVRDHGALGEGAKDDGVARTREHHQGPAREHRLRAWGGAARNWPVRCMLMEMREGSAYTTRWRFDLRMPPLKMYIASPTLHTACPGIGWEDRERHADPKETEEKYLDVLPLV